MEKYSHRGLRQSKRRGLFRFVAAFLFFLVAASTTAFEAEAQINRDLGDFGDPGGNGGTGIRFEFWNSTDGVNNDGIFDWYGTENRRSTADWDSAEIDAVMRGAQYWWDVLGSENTPGRDITIRLTRVGQRYSGSTWNDLASNSANDYLSSGGIDSTSTNLVWANGVATPADQVVDSSINFDADENLSALNGPLQMVKGSGIEATMIHEMAHTLGMTSGQPFSTPLGLYETMIVKIDEDGNRIPVVAGEDYADNAAFFFNGLHARAVYGDADYGDDGVAVPINTQSSQKSHLGINAFTMTHEDYRNYPFFTEVELAVIQDLGYTIDRSRFFGRSFYVDGEDDDPQTVNAITFNSTATYGVGLHVKASGRDILQTGDLNAGGVAGNGIRIDGNNNRVTIDEGVSIDTNNDFGVGLLVSNGVNNTVIHRGMINAGSTTSGQEGTGLMLNFGYNTLDGTNRTSATPEITSGGFSGDYLVDRVDITGSISAGGNAIYIGSSAAVEEINLMRDPDAVSGGPSIVGNIFSDAFTEIEAEAAKVSEEDFLEEFGRTLITFGRMADDDGQATNDADDDFDFTFNGVIGGTRLMEAQFVGGTTRFTNSASFHAVEVWADAKLDINGATILSETNLLIFDDGYLQGTPTITAPLVWNQSGGTIVPGNSIGTMTIVGDFDNDGDIDFELTHQHVPDVPQDADLIDVQGGAARINPNTVYATRGAFNFEAEPPASGNPHPYQVARRYTIIQTENPGDLEVFHRPDTTDDIDRRRIILRSDTDWNQLYTSDAQYYYAYIGRDVPFAEIANTPNQQAVGEYLDSIFWYDDGSSEANQIQWLRDTLDLIPDEGDMRLALSQLSGDFYASISPMVAQQSHMNYARLVGRLRSEWAEAMYRNTCDTDGYGYIDGQLCLGSPDCEHRGLHGWITSFGVGGQTQDDGNAWGYNYGAGGTQVVVAHQLIPEYTVGAFYNFTAGRLRGELGDSANVGMNEWGLFSFYQDDAAHFLLAAGGGFGDYRVRRQAFAFGNEEIQDPITFGGGNGRYGGSLFSFYTEYGRHYEFEYALLQPFLGLGYVTVGQNGFEEDGEGFFNLATGPAAYNSLRSMLGANMNYRFAGKGNRTLGLSAAWMHEFLNDGSAVILSQLGDLPSGPMGVQGVSYGRDFAVLGTRITSNLWGDNCRVFAGYDLWINTRQALHSGSGGVELAW